MLIFCEYDSALDRFLKIVVDHVLALFGNQLILDGLDEIELVRRIEGSSSGTDGRTIDNGRKIVLAASLYDALPCYDISQLQDNDDFQAIVCTIYHEMCHVSDRKTMPHIYAAAEDLDNERQRLAALLWVEYLAEKRSSEVGLAIHQEFCEAFVSRKWKSFRHDLYDRTEDNFVYLCKVLPYFMARTARPDARKHLRDRIANPLLRDYIEALDRELVSLERKSPFDDVVLLSDLSDIMDKYRAEFNRVFSHG